MLIARDKLVNHQFDDIEHTYSERDTILYALGLGLGADPLNRDQLKFVYEDGLKALPTMAVVLGYPGFWIKEPEFGADWKKVLHGEQGVILYKPLPASGTVVGKHRVTEAYDKGAGKGAIMLSERDVYDKATGELLCKLTSTTFLRGDGGFGGPAGSAPAPHAIPDRAPDTTTEIATLPQAALIYRLSGDYNPLHADPDVAKAGGFEAPILHGLCTFGVVGHALLKTIGKYDANAMKTMQVRFSAPVYPGETIVTEMWRDGNVVSFRAKVKERDIVVINNGKAEFK
ncbi:MaoC like domain protein [Variibacter gotjawalensis]|uniref:MaoC like domain protein n=1 Tax=Variibacter gotjawalensis TaxID=1333996 RepID=A0A0S3Q088_9BRAD|nr:MaoC/PaaZ C-terminal domain-containing protein [Variibacter gotjawalensis]NIK47230.1 acyl dehydratase [Variibacter gotjawalensis]RZS49130.1 acyl dehydratase [Variibacter gotjawalensis]BAT61392.1 MaoC like domain protein [Variibacter gotjawalensis]